MLRDSLTDRIGLADDKVLAQLSRELRAVLAEIESLDTAPEVSEIDRIVAATADELAVRRRRTDAATGT